MFCPIKVYLDVLDVDTFILDRESIEKIELRKLFVKSHCDAPTRYVLNINVKISSFIVISYCSL